MDGEQATEGVEAGVAHGLDEVQSNQKAMALDSLKSTRPIRTPASTPDEINELFDAIAYEKGAAVLRMVEEWVGEEAFQKGVNAYIDRFKYGNAAAEDFWGTLTSSTGKPVDRVMAGFVDQGGVPVINVETACTSGRGSATVGLRDAMPGRGAAKPRGWTIPVCVRTANGKPSCELVAATPTRVPLDSCPARVVANAGGRGYYRVSAPPEMLRSLAANLTSVAATERIALLADEWALVLAGSHNIDSFMDLATGFTAERSGSVMETLTNSLKAAARMAPAASRPRFNTWISGRCSDPRSNRSDGIRDRPTVKTRIRCAVCWFSPSGKRPAIQTSSRNRRRWSCTNLLRPEASSRRFSTRS